MHETRESPGVGGRRRARPWEKAAFAGLVLAVVAVLAFTAMAYGDGGSHGAAVPEERTVAVRRLLDTWAESVRTNDTETLKALFDEAAAPSFVSAEMARAENVASLSLSDWGYELVLGADNEVDTDLAARLGANEAWAPTVRLRYAIEGVDPVPTRKTISPTFVRRGDRWALLDDQVNQESPTWRGPWDHGPLITRRVDTGDGGTSMVIGHPDNTDMVDRLADDIGPAVDEVTELWGPEWSRAALVIVTSSAEEFTALVGDDHDGADIAAVAISDAPTPGDPEVGGQRVVFSPAANSRLDDDSRRAVLRHELMHVAARARTVDGSPMWLLEGYAAYCAHRSTESSARSIAPALAALIDAGGILESLPANSDFSDGDRGALAYQISWSINAFVADEFGEDALTGLYLTLATGSSRDDDVDDGLGAVLGIGTDTFVERWSGWLDEQFG